MTCRCNHDHYGHDLYAARVLTLLCIDASSGFHIHCVPHLAMYVSPTLLNLFCITLVSKTRTPLLL